MLITEKNQPFTRGIYTEHHQLVADEPLSYGGANLGPNPYEYLLASLGACTSMTVRMYANHKALDQTNAEVILNHSRIHCEDCQDCECEDGFVDKIERLTKLEGDLTEAQRQRLTEIADKRPVHKTLKNEILIKSELI